MCLDAASFLVSLWTTKADATAYLDFALLQVTLSTRVQSNQLTFKPATIEVRPPARRDTRVDDFLWPAFPRAD